MVDLKLHRSTITVEFDAEIGLDAHVTFSHILLSALNAAPLIRGVDPGVIYEVEADRAFAFDAAAVQAHFVLQKAESAARAAKYRADHASELAMPSLQTDRERLASSAYWRRRDETPFVYDHRIRVGTEVRLKDSLAVARVIEIQEVPEPQHDRDSPSATIEYQDQTTAIVRLHLLKVVEAPRAYEEDAT